MLFMLFASFWFGVMHVGVRHITSQVHPFEATFFRNLFGLLVLVPSFLAHGWRPLRTRRPGLHLLRALLNVIAMLAFFWALSLAPVARVQALTFTAPIFTSVLAVFLLGERIRARRVAAVVIGFAGALVIIRPGLEPIDLGSVLTLSSAAIWGLTMIVIKTLARTESAITITSYMLILMTPMSFVAALYVWSWPTPEQLLWLLGVGVSGTIAQLSMAQAFRLADATVVLPLDCTKLVWGALIAYIAFGERVAAWTWLGAAIIFSGALYLAYRERRTEQGQQR